MKYPSLKASKHNSETKRMKEIIKIKSINEIENKNKLENQQKQRFFEKKIDRLLMRLIKKK